MIGYGDRSRSARIGLGQHIGYSEAARLESDLIRNLNPHVRTEERTVVGEGTGIVSMVMRAVWRGAYQPPTRVLSESVLRLPDDVAERYSDSMVQGIHGLVSGELNGEDLSRFCVTAQVLSGWWDSDRGQIRPGNTPLDALSRLASHLAKAVAIREGSDPAKLYPINGRPVEMQYSTFRDASDRSDQIHQDLQFAKGIVDANYSQLSGALGLDEGETELRAYLNGLVATRLGNVRPLVWDDAVQGQPFSGF